MAKGKVKWFSESKGYGFIEPEGGGDDVFVHYSVIESEGFRTLTEGQSVDFEMQKGPKGFLATEVTPNTWYRRSPVAIFCSCMDSRFFLELYLREI